MVQEFAGYVHDCPPDPSHFLEIHDLVGLGVDPSFFPDQSQVIFPEPTQPKIEAPTVEVGLVEVADPRDMGVPEVTP